MLSISLVKAIRVSEGKNIESVLIDFTEGIYNAINYKLKRSRLFVDFEKVLKCQDGQDCRL